MDVKFSSKRSLTPEEEAEIQQLIESDLDAPEAIDEALANARPFRDVFPDLAASIDRERASRGRGRGRPPVEAPKVAVTIRLEPEVVERFKAQGGKEWRGKMTDALRKAAGL